MPDLTYEQQLILEAAAGYNIFRVCGSATPGKRADFRTRIGVPVPFEGGVARLIELGLIGRIAPAERLEDGTLVERIDVSEAGLALYLEGVS